MRLSAHGHLITTNPSRYHDNPEEKELLLVCDMIKNRLWQAEDYDKEFKRIITEIVDGSHCNHYYSIIPKLAPPAIANWFSPLFQLQSYLLGICYLIDNSVKYNDNNLSYTQHPSPTLNHNEIIAWLKPQIAPSKSIIIDKNCLQRLILDEKSGIIYLNKLEVLKIKKLIKHREDHFLFHSQKISPIGDEYKFLYVNIDRKCLPLSVYFLQNMSIALNSVNSREPKNKFTSSLLVKTQFANYETLKNNPAANTQSIDSSWINFNNFFHPIQEITTTNSTAEDEITLGHGLVLAVTLMQYNRLNQIYILVFSTNHAMAIAISSQHDMAKLLFYDPNCSDGYLSFYIPLPNIPLQKQDFPGIDEFNKKFKSTITRLNDLIQKRNPKTGRPYLEYLNRNRDKRLSLTFRCYTPNITVGKNTQFRKLPNDFFAECFEQLEQSITVNKHLSTKTVNAQMMEIAILSMNTRMIKAILSKNAKDYNYPGIDKDIDSSDSIRSRIEKNLPPIRGIV